jgi:hypothetical protein
MLSIASGAHGEGTSHPSRKMASRSHAYSTATSLSHNGVASRKSAAHSFSQPYAAEWQSVQSSRQTSMGVFPPRGSIGSGSGADVQVASETVKGTQRRAQKRERMRQAYAGRFAVGKYVMTTHVGFSGTT